MTTHMILSVLLAAAPKVGDKAPDFTVTDTEGKTYALKTLLAEGPVVLAFFPKAQTSGCTRELTGYTAQYQELRKYKATLIAVSMDDLAVQREFKAILSAPFPMIPDHEGKVVEAYDVKMPMVPVAKRRTFVIDRLGTIVHIDEGGDAIEPKGAITALHDLSS